ncbi:uncharacterized protein BXIN_3006 [Babesia sp. Xinjiang]|uniref:uncharacterized protein n=1 Tax=Babesia sp. Xinjiang TaxID=462227 RepID=UPI000A226969|nr:uncharacterized protein BXIN_3006 [Babesia sp. Xinjiang]ORM39388.1 hypothetical protein BXIN_3006 [Babesia sp. Xinjiang]
MHRPLIFGHRGVGCSIPGTLGLLPENSISSFLEARRLGADGVELDVFLSKNDEILVVHGHLAKNSLCLTTLKKDGLTGVKQFLEDDLIEKYDSKSSDLLLKKPWRLLQSITDIDVIIKNHKSNVAASFQSYIDNLEHAEGEHVPTLDEVFEKLGDTFQYNIELKGSRPELGPRVLDAIERHPKVKVVISSFQWIPPKLDPSSPHAENALEALPNGKITVDLLRPLVNNRLGVPIGLLFNNETSELPSLERMVECTRSYHAEWVSLAHDFWTTETPILGAAVKGLDALHHLVTELHKKGLKIMTYFLESVPDTEKDMKLQLASGVDAICPNDVELAMKCARQ